MKERPGVMLYFENRDCIDALSDADAGQLVKATLRYAQTGERPQFEGLLNIVWLLLRPIIDRDAERYRYQCLTKTYAVYCRTQDKKGEERLSFDDWCLSNETSDTLCYPTTTTTTNTTSNTTTATTPDTTPTANTTTASTAAATADEAPSVFTSTEKINHLGLHRTVVLTNKDYFELQNKYGQQTFLLLIEEAERRALERGYDPDTLDWPKFIQFCHENGGILDYKKFSTNSPNFH